MTRIVAIALAIAATTLWISAARGGGGLYGRAGIGAMTLTGLFAAICPLGLRARRASAGRRDDGARIAAAAAVAIMVIGAVALTDHFAVAARFGDGTRGTISFPDVVCSQNCVWSGQFWVRQHPKGNWVDQAAVTMITEASGQNLRRHRIPAIDVGDPSQVYPLGGGPQWAEVRIVAVTTTAAAALLIAVLLALRYRRSRRNWRMGDGPH